MFFSLFLIIPDFTSREFLLDLQDGLLNHLPSSASSFSHETDTIDPQRSSSPPVNPFPFTPSESPVPGPLNLNNASRSSSSSALTISFDVTSFTTDNQHQPWLPSPPPQLQPHLASNLLNDNKNSAYCEDFVLYPSVPAPCPQPRPTDLRAPLPQSTALRSAAYHPSLVQNHLRRRALARQNHLPQQCTPSSVQSPQVTRLVPQSTGFSLSPSSRFSPFGRKQVQRFYATSAPSNSPLRNRPPVPFLPGVAYCPNQNQQQQQQVYHPRVMSTPNLGQGKLPLVSQLEPSFLTHHQIWLYSILATHLTI